MKFKKMMDLLNIAELNSNDTVGSAFIKGATNVYVKGALIGGLVHLGIKAYEHYNGKESENGEA